MIIRGFNINGFGVFHQTEAQGLSSGLNIFLGENEAGKSTLLAFIRAVLFGFPANRGGINTYPPLHGGAHGGSLILDGAEGPVIITRSPGSYGGTVSVAYPGGAKGGRDDLLHMLGGTTAALYNNVYAFSLSELETLQSLTNEEVASALYGASLGAGVQSLSNARKKIAQKTGELFKPSGKNPLINQTISEFKENAVFVGQAAKDADVYQASVEEINGLGEAMKSSRAAVKKFREDILYYEKIINLWDHWIAYSQAKASLDGLPQDAIMLPEGSRPGLESVLEKMEEAGREIVVLKEEAAAEKIKAASLPVEPGLLDLGGVINSLNGEYARFRENQETLQRLSNQWDQKNLEVEALCKSLGEGWTRERLANRKGALFSKQELEANDLALSRAAEAAEQAKGRKSMRTEALEELRAEEDRRRESLEKVGAPGPAWESVLQSGQDPLVKAKAEARELSDLTAQEQRLAQEQTHLDQRMADAAASAWKRKRGAMPAFVFIIVAICCLALSLAKPELHFLLYLGGAGLIISCLIFIINSKTQPSAAFVEKMARKDPEFGRMSQTAEALAKNLKATKDKIESLAASLDLQTPVSLQALSELFTCLDNESERYRVWSGLYQGLMETGQKREAAASRLQEADSLYKEAEKKQTEAHAAWRVWLEEQGLPTSLSPRSAREALESMEKGAEILRQALSLERDIAQCRQTIQEFEDKLHRLAGSLGAPYPQPGMIQAMLQDLSDRLEKTRRNLAVKEEISSGLKGLERKILEKNLALEQLAEKRKGFLAQAQAENEEEFLEKFLISSERRIFLAKLESSAAAMGNISGEKDLSRLLILLETLDRDACRIKLQEARDALALADEEFESQAKRSAELNAGLKNMASDKKISRLRAKEGELAEKMRSQALQWGAYTLAGAFLERAVAVLEQEQQPEVITRAGVLFREITDGRYERIYAPLGEGGIELIMQDGVRKSPAQLSRGTAELLYLCLRMGYIESRSVQGANLPVVMDDVLVNFDAQRASQAAKAISSLARGRQVILFTCHKRFVELFKGGASDLQSFILNCGNIIPA
ncbi:conserved hypothetical protein-like protein [Desulfatibacillum aliphaticivorans]|uniref:YhaN AAA domain-containing protein n=1 Tax=Desulfatibacillum aliphaticivorans TaxID=218208 RepID=B8FC83_DESAL|nr:AAA family ATPase [Desulfatibacillum aliphaticivorans]ACL05501.1 conserved hypothetical protein-like protein [Desulfatibacillum aliphaticivorans]